MSGCVSPATKSDCENFHTAPGGDLCRLSRVHIWRASVGLRLKEGHQGAAGLGGQGKGWVVVGTQEQAPQPFLFLGLQCTNPIPG